MPRRHRALAPGPLSASAGRPHGYPAGLAQGVPSVVERMRQTDAVAFGLLAVAAPEATEKDVQCHARPVWEVLRLGVQGP